MRQDREVLHYSRYVAYTASAGENTQFIIVLCSVKTRKFTHILLTICVWDRRLVIVVIASLENSGRLWRAAEAGAPGRE
jgi:hypothetical protein